MIKKGNVDRMKSIMLANLQYDSEIGWYFLVLTDRDSYEYTWGSSGQKVLETAKELCQEYHMKAYKTHVNGKLHWVFIPKCQDEKILSKLYKKYLKN